MHLYLIVLFTFVVAFVLSSVLKDRRFEKYLKHIPGPYPLPIIGNALDFPNTREILIALCKYRDRFRTTSKIQIGPDRMIILPYDYKFLEFVMSSNKLITKSHDYEYLHDWLGLGLLTSTGEKWQKRRKIITPSFHFQILEQFLDVFHGQGDVLVDKLKKEVAKDRFDIYPYVTLCALDVICESAMGIKVNAQSESQSQYVVSVKEMSRIMFERSIHPLKQYEFFFRLSKDYIKAKKNIEVLHQMTNSVIRSRRELVKKMQVKKEDDGSGIKRRLAFLDMLLEATDSEGKPLSNEDIREEVDTFMFEGHDTTASGISFALYLLSKNPECQEKAFQEIKDIFGEDKTRAPTYKELQNMKYLEMVISESLRLYPSVPLFGRQVTEDTEFDGKILPKGVTIGIPVHALHRDPEVFPDPEKFDPERFNSENKTGRKPYCYIPFSAGPRNCIGQKFAVLELKSTLSKVLRHFKLLPAENYEPVLIAETILKASNGIYVRLEERIY